MLIADENKALVALAGLVCFSLAPSAQSAPPGGLTLARLQPKTLSIAQAAAADKTETRATVSADGKALTFRQRAVRLVVRSGPGNDMLSYRVDGLRNPTLVVPAGATLKALFINTDDDMTHNLRLTAQRPPFKGTAKSVGTSNLAHKAATSYHAEEMTVRVPATGTYTYLCTIPGHAPGGMYGTLIVR